jgi:hypothetical protein
MSYAVAFKDTTIINSANPANGYHWLMWNIPESINVVPRNLSTPAKPTEMGGATQKSPIGTKFFGPCPSTSCTSRKKDTYSFTVYAMGSLTVNPTGTVQQQIQWLESNALKKTEVTGTSDAAPKGTNCPTTGGPDGAALFASKCVNCHTAASKANHTAAQIKTAINGVSRMSGLKTMTDAEIAAIAAFLKK